MMARAYRARGYDDDTEDGAPFTGRWRIVSMDGLTSGNIDYRITERGGQPAVEWTWEGLGDMDPCTGRGLAVLEGDELHGMIFFHQGDESAFVASRVPKRRRPKRK
jgi:hypothetical protein